MKQFAYPAICYKDVENETITLLLPDADIIASGDNVEDAFWSAKSHLKSYIDWSIKFDTELPTASNFEEVARTNSRKSVLLVDAESNAKKVDMVQAEQSFNNFIHDFFE